MRGPYPAQGWPFVSRAEHVQLVIEEAWVVPPESSSPAAEARTPGGPLEEYSFRPFDLGVDLEDRIRPWGVVANGCFYCVVMAILLKLSLLTWDRIRRELRRQRHGFPVIPVPPTEPTE